MFTRLARSFAGPMAALMVLSLMASDALASKARMKALSQSENGSLFIKDNRDIFLNPAMVNELESNVNFEWGSPAATYADGAKVAEGGAIYRTGLLNYAVELGRLGSSTLSMVEASSLASVFNGSTLFYAQNSIDAVVGGSAGVLKWGGGVHYARSVKNTGSSANFPDQTARVLSLSGGLLAGSLSGFARLDVLAESSTDLSGGGSRTYGGKLGGELGGKLDIDPSQAVGLTLGQTSYHFDNASALVGDYQRRHIRGDYFRLFEVKENTVIFASAGIAYYVKDVSYTTLGVQSVNYTTLTSPVALGFEHKALSWLGLRGSVTQNILLDQDKQTDGTNDHDYANLEDTSVGAGFSAYVGDLQIDGTFAGVTTGVLNGSSLAADVAFLYRF